MVLKRRALPLTHVALLTASSYVTLFTSLPEDPIPMIEKNGTKRIQVTQKTGEGCCAEEPPHDSDHPGCSLLSLVHDHLAPANLHLHWPASAASSTQPRHSQ